MRASVNVRSFSEQRMVVCSGYTLRRPFHAVIAREKHSPSLGGRW